MKNWIYTPEQAQAIKSGDIPARNTFYFDNYHRLEVMAQTFVSARRNLGQTQFEVGDLLSQVYLDLPYLSYNSPAALTFSVKNSSFRLSVFGGLAHFVETKAGYTDTQRYRLTTISTDQTIKDGSDNEVPFIDVYCSAPSVEEEIEKRDTPDYTEQLRKILGNYLKERQVDFLLLDCEGYTQAEACRKLGVKAGSIPKSPILKKLRSSYMEIVDALAQINCEAVLPYIGVIPSDKALRHYKMSAEERAKAAARTRALRARKKAAQATT